MALMRYIINDFVLNTDERTLSLGEDSKTIRPRTLELLLYFISNKDTIISKNELLKTVWSDVIVDEGVVFISISEIRKMFGDSKIIINHPRKGYQFTGKVKCDPVTKPNIRSKWPIISALVLVSLSLVILFIYTNNDTKPKITNQQKRILILPIHNEIHYEDKRWLKLGGMDHLISVLQESTVSEYVFDIDQSIELIKASKFTPQVTPLDIQRLFDLSGATHIIETTFVGRTQEYTIALTINGKTNIHKKVIFAKSIGQGLSLVAQEILQEFDGTSTAINAELRLEFKHELFAEAMLAYETDWESAISFFESYLNIEPNSTIAMMYLTRLYIWRSYPEKALKLATILSEHKNLDAQAQAEIFYFRAKIASLLNEYEEAITWFQRATSQLQKSTDSLLLARINESYGEAWFSVKQYKKAIKRFNKALDSFNASEQLVSICSTKLKIARTYHMLGQPQAATENFQQAYSMIKKHNISLLHEELQKATLLLNPDV